MIFVFGGAHQGMQEYVENTCGVREIHVLDENTVEIDFSGKAISGLERFVLGCVRRGMSAQEYFARHEKEWKECVFVGTDFSCGVVPMDAEMRLWREENGRLNNYLAAQADQVIRMFCGIAQVIK